VLENLALAIFRADTRSIDVPYTLDHGGDRPGCSRCPRVVAFGAALVVVGVLLCGADDATDLGRAIRAVAKEKHRRGAGRHRRRPRLRRDLRHRPGLPGRGGLLLLPAFYVNPRVGNAFVLVAFTIVVLGGMGSVPGALLGGLLIGVVESAVAGSISASPRADRHLPDLHPGAAVPADRPVRGAA
jgi:branched-chain amino acid transport system permease protein